MYDLCLIRVLFLQILVVIEPLLIDEDYYARVEGREIISNLAKVGKNPDDASTSDTWVLHLNVDTPLSPHRLLVWPL